MGVEYNKRAVGFKGGMVVPSETITLSTAVQTLADDGLSLVVYDTSGQTNDMILAKPSRAGIVKKIVVDNQTTSNEANLNLATTGSVFYGTTYNTATLAAAAGTKVALPSLELVSVSTVSWAVTAISSTAHWTFAASTGSTGQ